MARTRLLILIVAGVTLGAACAAGPALAHHKSKAHAPSSLVKPRARAPAHDEAQAESAPLDVETPAGAPVYGGLLSLSETEARARLGLPDIAREEGAGAMWTYRLQDCALFVFFRAPGGQALKVSGATSGPRQRGQTPIPVQACIAQALSAHR